MATITWEALKSRIGNKAVDPSLTKATDIYLDAGNDALLAFASHHTPLTKSCALTPDSSTKLFPLPEDAIEGNAVYGVLYDGVWLPPIEMVPGERPAEEMGYILRPMGMIEFSIAPTTGRTLTLYYNAYYPAIEDDESLITVPGWAQEAVAFYAAARVVEIDAGKQARLGNYKDKQDSGKPTDNPLLELSAYYIKQYWQILAQHPASRMGGI